MNQRERMRMRIVASTRARFFSSPKGRAAAEWIACAGRASLALCYMIAAMALVAVEAQAQAYPMKPIRLVVPFAPGGAGDVVGRAILDPMSKDLGQSIVIFNRDGAGTILGVDMVAKSIPDGYTILLSGDAGVINTASGRKLPYDFMKDLVPISMVYAGAQVMLVAKDSRFKSVQDLVRFAKANPGKIMFGSGGIGTVVHLTSESFNQAAGIEALHVPYKGVGPAMTDLMGGRIDYIIGGATSIPSIKSGAVRGIAIFSRERTGELPELQTALEQGVNLESSSWYGLYTTAGTPPEIVRMLHAALMRALDARLVKERFLSVGGEPRPMTQEQFIAFLQAEIQRLSALMKRVNIQLD